MVKTFERLAVLETKVGDISQDVQDIKNNHLPHIESRLRDVEKKIAYYVGGLGVIITLTQIIIQFIK